MIDWDRLVVESEHNGVIASAGQVALLVGADAVGVNWGNILGDITQQPDLMLELDSKIGIDSPTFTGVPRTPTPPAGNSSTRIASTAFVQGELNNITVDYETQVTNKPTLGALADHDNVDYVTEVTNKPTFGELAFKDKAAPADIVHPTDIYVDKANGNDTTGTGDWSAPYKTINKALQGTSDLYLTTIMIYGASYDENIYVEDKHVWLYCLSMSTAPVSIGTLTVRRGTVYIFGNFEISKIDASRNSVVTYREGTSQGVTSMLVITSDSGKAITADNGSVISIASDIVMKASSSTNTALSASNGSIISAPCVTSYDSARRVSVGTLFNADNSIIICRKGFINCYTEKTVSNGGFAGVFGNLASKNSVSYSTEVTDKPTFGALATKNVADYDDDIVGKPTFGDLAFKNEPPYVQNPDDHMTHIPRYVRKVNSQGQGSWVELDEAPSEYDTYGKSCYVRTSYAYVSPIDGSLSLMHGWKNIDPPINRQETPKYYVRSNDSLSGHPNGQWYEIWYAIDAPSDGHTYARRNGEWVRIE